MSGPEARFLAWAGVVVAVMGLIAAVLLPGVQGWLCRNGVRLTCDAGKTTVDVTFRHQLIPRSASAVLQREILASQLSFDGGQRLPIVCDDPQAELDLAGYERLHVDDGPPPGIVRGDEDHVIAQISVSYPSSDWPMDIEVEMTIRPPKGTSLFPAFGPDEVPTRMWVTLRSPANAGRCDASFLVALGKESARLSTSGWRPGKYDVDIDVRGGAEGHLRRGFELR